MFGNDHRKANIANPSWRKLSLKVVDGGGFVPILIFDGSSGGRPKNGRIELKEYLPPPLEIKDLPFGIGVLVPFTFVFYS